MSTAPVRARPRPDPWVERAQPWIAALLSILLQVLFALILLYAPTPSVNAPKGAPGGGRMKVDFVGGGPRTTPPTRTQARAAPPPQAEPTPTHRQAPHVQSALVQHSDNPLPPESTTAHQRTRPQRRPPVKTPPVPQPAPQPAPTPATTVQDQAPSSMRRDNPAWGHPPGFLPEDHADDDQGTASTSQVSRGYGQTPDVNGPSMGIGGYQVYYDLSRERLLQSWKERGMTEVFLPLPGARQLMVCPLQVALDRSSGKCRLLPPDSPELKAIGDAREVIRVMDVYHQGSRVWQGPGAYR